MEILEAIGALLLGFVKAMVLLSALLVRGIVWIAGAIAKQFGWDFGPNFVNNVVLVVAVILTLYLGVGFILITAQTISVEYERIFYGNIIVYPMIILSGILWVGYFGSPSNGTSTNRPFGIDLYGLYFIVAIVPLLMVIASFYFLAAKTNFENAQRQIERKQACIETRIETASKLDKLAARFGFGEKTSDKIGEKLIERCK